MQMAKRQASLSDKFDLAETRQLLTGTQAVVRLMLMQKARDEAAGLDTAGYVTGYRGSPIASLEAAFQREAERLTSRSIRFQPGLNEDLAATAVWGTQQAELRGEGKYDGVFAIWYGKGPGVDRSGDAFRHANHAGTSGHGGVLALMGDDHTCESSTSAHQSEFAFVDAMMPVFNPAGVQEILDYGIIGLALSRYAGVWVGLKCVKDNIESTATVDGRLDRVAINLPAATDFQMPAGGLNIRRGDTALAKEARLHDYKRPAILAFSRANALDRIDLSGGANPKIGIITTGKSYLDTRQALDELGIDEVRAAALGLRLMKVAMSWPLEPRGIERFAKGLDLILVIEEKRALIETQVKEQLYDTPGRPAVLGKKDEAGRWLFPAKGALDPLDIAVTIGDRILAASPDPALAHRVAELKTLIAARPAGADAFPRTPHFCAGCPHNTSTIVPEGSHAYAGIGCHYMALWMDRETEGFTQMGGEGANWIGEAPFSTRGHVFQNLGDGTYIHSGSLAIRAAVAAGATMTFKILYNDAVAMTGGQKLDGGITVPQMAAQVLAEGISRLDIVTDEPGKYGAGAFAPGVHVHHRRDLAFVQRTLANTPGVSALIYDQTCAAEKRRRRKRGTMPNPDIRVVINAAVCEGCGDCGVKSNCIAIQPLETDLGRKRTIDQSACNKDLSCQDGFCPSFVTLHGAKVRRPDTVQLAADRSPEDTFARLPAPELPDLRKPYAILVTGVGGTGVVTISAVLAQAAHVAGRGFGSIDVTGLAQKGGAVACHMRIAERPEDIHAIRVGTAHADLVLGGDLVVTAGNKILDALRPGHTAVVYSTYELMTGPFARDPLLQVPGAALRDAIKRRADGAPLAAIDAHEMAMSLFGDSIYANMMLLGYAHQAGHVPMPADAIEQAIGLNGVDIARNLAAFRFGRLARGDPAAFQRLLPAKVDTASAQPLRTWDAIAARRSVFLASYQDQALASQYLARVSAIAALEGARVPGQTALSETVAAAYFRLLAYKDEYEVARLFTNGIFAEQLDREFTGTRRVEFHMAPPLFARRDKVTGHPRKMTFGPWLMPLLRILAKGRRLRGTPFDPFGYTNERRRERRLIEDYERLLDSLPGTLSPQTHATCVELAALPLQIVGYGHVKATSIERAEAKRQKLAAQLAGGRVRQAAE
jgi:indolepyruvate ferredoxin oxidoreductase